MKITYDLAKRAAALRNRWLDFKDAVVVFQGVTVDQEDVRFDYGETRMVTVGLLDSRMVVIAWTPRGDTRRVISMRKANQREQAKYESRLRR